MPPKLSIQSHSGLLDTWGRRNRKLADKACNKCGKTFHPKRMESKYCSKQCRWACNGGHNKKPETWWINAKGYREGRIWVDGKQVAVKEHRLIVERHLGRKLLITEDVHHIDGNKLNNTIANLKVVWHSEHTKITNAGRVYKRGYKLNLTPEARAERSLRARRINLGFVGRSSLSKSTLTPSPTIE